MPIRAKSKTLHSGPTHKIGEPRLLPRIHEPANLESSFDALQQITPNRFFFVRSHFPVPKIPKDKWRLRVEGAVEKPLSLSLRQLEAMPCVTEISVLECAGNGRLFLNNVPEGVQWELGAVGCASWTGVPLRDVLAQAHIGSDAVDIVLQGADRGTPEKPTKPKDEIHFARSLPVSVAQRPDVILAYKMNGEPLPLAHGAPLRAIVPGWYGVAAVKWLSRITVATNPFYGYFQTVEYAYWKSEDVNLPERLPLSEYFLKSAIARPAMHERIRRGSSYRIFGAAWSPDSSINTVEVSTNGGKSWNQAELGDESSSARAWRRWEWQWRPAEPGKFTLMSRATDVDGRVQPAEHDDNYESYAIHHTLPISVEVC